MARRFILLSCLTGKLKSGFAKFTKSFLPPHETSLQNQCGCHLCTCSPGIGLLSTACYGQSFKTPVGDYRIPALLYESESVSHSVCSTLCDHMNCSPPGSSVHGILLFSIVWGRKQKQANEIITDVHVTWYPVASRLVTVVPLQGSEPQFEECAQKFWLCFKMW